MSSSRPWGWASAASLAHLVLHGGDITLRSPVHLFWGRRRSRFLEEELHPTGLLGGVGNETVHNLVELFIRLQGKETS